MRKAYAIADFLSEDNRKMMSDAAGECGFEISFFDSAAEASGNVADAEVAYTDGAAILAEMPGLRWCHSAYAGAGGFIKSGIFSSGEVLLTNSSGAYGVTISEHIIMVTLMLMRRMPEYLRITAERRWMQELPIRSVRGSSIAIAGTGDIGSNAAKRYKALGAEKVIGFSRSGSTREGFDAVYKLSEFEEVIGGMDAADKPDVLLLCLPGTPMTKGFLNAEKLALLSEKTLVINVGRGMVIDQDALIQALNEGRIAGAALDVVYPEPLPEDHPLWTAKNCLITPHCSGDMGLPYTVGVTVDIFCDNLRRYVRGEKLTHLVDIEAGY